MNPAVKFVLDHQTVIMALGVAVLDLAFSINPQWRSNGVLHWVFIKIGGKDTVAPVEQKTIQ